MDRLLLIACSQRKRQDPELLPAIERYDGPAFRVVRRYLRGNPSLPPRLYILSAKYGLIEGETLIHSYDLILTPDRAQSLAPQVASKFARVVAKAPCTHIFLALSQRYLSALPDYEAWLPPGTAIRLSRGGQGRRLAELYDWLYNEPRPESFPVSADAPSRRLVGSMYHLDTCI